MHLCQSEALDHSEITFESPKLIAINSTYAWLFLHGWWRWCKMLHIPICCSKLLSAVTHPRPACPTSFVFRPYLYCEQQFPEPLLSVSAQRRCDEAHGNKHGAGPGELTAGRQGCTLESAASAQRHLEVHVELASQYRYLRKTES